MNYAQKRVSSDPTGMVNARLFAYRTLHVEGSTSTTGI